LPKHVHVPTDGVQEMGTVAMASGVKKQGWRGNQTKQGPARTEKWLQQPIDKGSISRRLFYEE
ncbi:MAG: hypothetical protein VYB72_10115, partial [Planctomycetota bacterium]|nr:hypothetical protein [Planctomycetota bacterium]